MDWRAVCSELPEVLEYRVGLPAPAGVESLLSACVELAEELVPGRFLKLLTWSSREVDEKSALVDGDMSAGSFIAGACCGYS